MTDHQPTRVEYRVITTQRYIVTRYAEQPNPTTGMVVSGSAAKGEFHNPEVAYEIAYALAKEEHDRLGWPAGDERMQYPKGDPRYPADVVGADASQINMMLIDSHPLARQFYDLMLRVENLGGSPALTATVSAISALRDAVQKELNARTDTNAS